MSLRALTSPAEKTSRSESRQVGRLKLENVSFDNEPVSLTRPLPSAFMTYNSARQRPLLNSSLRKAIRVPSGDQVGVRSRKPPGGVRTVRPDPSAPTVLM